MTQLTCCNLSLGYDSKTVVENLSFSIDESDYLCIVGENGSGKSTLIKALLGLHAPQSGEIHILLWATTEMFLKTADFLAV